MNAQQVILSYPQVFPVDTGDHVGSTNSVVGSDGVQHPVVQLPE
jgi:hypothetical protein